jgi:hypothetical protein
MLNDQLGNCTIAALGHIEQVWTAKAGKYIMTLPDDCILQKYEQWCGYDPSDPNTDQGGVEIDVLNHYRTSPGLWKHTLDAYADPSAADIEHVRKAIELFGAVYIGVQLPLSAQGAQIWDYTGKHPFYEIPGSWGGHAVIIPKYETLANGETLFTCISWGGLYQITERFWLYNDPMYGPYIDEVHAPLGKDWLRWKGMPEGFDYTQLQADLIQITP